MTLCKVNLLGLLEVWFRVDRHRRRRSRPRCLRRHCRRNSIGEVAVAVAVAAAVAEAGVGRGVGVGVGGVLVVAAAAVQDLMIKADPVAPAQHSSAKLPNPKLTLL